MNLWPRGQAFFVSMQERVCYIVLLSGIKIAQHCWSADGVHTIQSQSFDIHLIYSPLNDPGAPGKALKS